VQLRGHKVGSIGAKEVAVAKKQAYEADDIQTLEGLEAVRKRPGMYIGSTGSPGLQHCMWEIADNSVDEALGGHCNQITVTLHPDRSVEVQDNGRGIPVGINAKTGLSAVELVYTRLHAGGKFGGSSYAAVGGLHGVGASVVNALSQRLDVFVDREGATYTMSFERGEPGVFDANGKFTPKAGLTKVRGSKPTGTGTRVRYWADRTIFLADAEIDLSLTYDRARQTAFMVPGLNITVIDQRTPKGETEVFCYEGGTKDFVEYIAPDPAVCDPIVIKAEGTFEETVPVLEDGHLVTRTLTRSLGVDVAMRWGQGYETTLRSFVNIIATPKGGTHVTGFERGLVKTMGELVVQLKAAKANEESPAKEDVLEGLSAIVCVRLDEPQFEGQTKEILGTAAVTKIVNEIVSEGLRNWALAKSNADQAKRVAAKVVLAGKTRRELRLKKDTIRRKNALETSTLPAKLSDCFSDDLELTELILVEGDSAAGTLKKARDSNFQAILPLRGKILNTFKKTEKEMLDNAECAAIITAVGAGSGKSFDLSSIRYGKLIAMSVERGEPVLMNIDGLLHLRPIGPMVDNYLADNDPTPSASVASLDAPAMATRLSPLKQVIRHYYHGDMLHITTALGRTLSVTAGHSVFILRDNKITLVRADEIEVGTLVVAPRTLPRSNGFDAVETEEGETTRDVRLTKTTLEALGRYAFDPLADFSDLRQSSGEPTNSFIATLQGLYATTTPLSDHSNYSFLLNLAPELQLAFLRGYYLPQAHVDDTCLRINLPSTTALSLVAASLAQLGALAYVDPATLSLKVNDLESLELLRPVWENRLPGPDHLSLLGLHLPESQAYVLSPTLLALPVTAVSSSSVDTEVYDLSVADDESFVAGRFGGVMAHNTDADVDGSHIRCLIFTLIYRYMRPLFEDGRVYAAVPPLFGISVTGAKELIYTYNEEEHEEKLAELEAAGKKVKGIQRYKGLGEMDADQLADTTLDPERRALRRITIADIIAAEDMFQVLMGEPVPPRREYILAHAADVDRAALDI
jgi:DNA gyrase subunit B